MRRTELHYRKTREPSFSSGNRTNPPQPKGSAGGDIEQRIVALYRNGQSIESITREVGRARHLVVHVLHSTGVFGTVQPEMPPEMAETADTFAQENGPAIRQSELADKTAEDADAAPAKTVPRVKRIRRSKPKEAAPVLAAAKTPAVPMAPPPAAVSVRAASNWSPLIVDALFKVVTQSETDSGMSVEEVRRMVSKPKRSRPPRM